MDSFISERLLYLKGLKNPSELQKLFILLAEKSDKTAKDNQKFNLLVKAEKSLVAADKAKVAAMKFLQEEHKKDQIEARKARNHRLIKQGTLFDLAGLQDKDMNELLGALLAMAKVQDESKWLDWKRSGSEFLAQKEKESKQSIS